MLRDDVQLMHWTEAVSFNESDIRDLRWLHDKLLALNVRSLSDLENRIARA